MNAITLHNPQPLTLQDTLTLGKVLAESGMFQDARGAAQAVAKIMAGAELGFPALASMTGVYVVKGRITLSANLIAAAIKRTSKYNYRVVRMDDKGCEIVFLEDGQEVGRSSFTEEDAKKAGLAGGDNWRKYPRNMYFARALSNGAKWFCPDVFGGPVYTPDELGATVDGDTGEVIDVPSVEVIEPVEETPPAASNGQQVGPEGEMVYTCVTCEGIVKPDAAAMVQAQTGKVYCKEHFTAWFADQQKRRQLEPAF